MNWSGWSEFMAMGGYGGYVWGAMAMVGLVVAAEIGQIVLRRSTCRQRLNMLYAVERDHEDQNET